MQRTARAQPFRHKHLGQKPLQIANELVVLGCACRHPCRPGRDSKQASNTAEIVTQQPHMTTDASQLAKEKSREKQLQLSLYLCLVSVHITRGSRAGLPQRLPTLGTRGATPYPGADHPGAPLHGSGRFRPWGLCSGQTPSGHHVVVQTLINRH